MPTDMLINKGNYIEPEQGGKFFVRPETQMELNTCNPNPDHFSGKAYLCTNGGTASAASTLLLLFKIITSACWLDRKEEVAIASYSGTKLSAMVYPQLTTVEQLLVKMGETVAELILEKIINPAASNKTIALTLNLMYRVSIVVP